MAKSRSGASGTVVKREDDESAMRWIECKALLADIWKNAPVVPSAPSRRAWALAHGVDPIRVHVWFGNKKATRTRRGIPHHPEDGYTLSLDSQPEGQPSSSISLDVAPPLDNPSSPSYIFMSSPPPRTPIDIFNDPPIAVSLGSLFEEELTVHPSSQKMSYSRSIIPTPSIHPNKVDLAIKSEMIGAIPSSDLRAPASSKTSRILLRVAPDTESGSSKRPRKESANAKPNTTTVPPKKKRQAKKVPKVEAPDDEGGSPEKSALDQVSPMMIWPQNPPPGFCTPPYYACYNPTMTFGNGMPATQNLPPHSFGNIMYNPFTGAPLFNNMLPQFSTFPDQPSQSAFFNGNADVGFPGQMASQFPASPLPGPSFSVPENDFMNQNFFAGNFQGFQSGMPADGAPNLQNQEPTMSLTDFLNAPLDAKWSYT